MLRKTIKCPRCDRRFSMQGHLARHLSTMHVSGGAKKTAKRKPANGRRKRRMNGYASTGARMGRPTGIASRMGLRDMSLDQLGALIEAAKQEARVQIAAMQEML